MEFTHQAFMKVDRFDVVIGDQVAINWRDYTNSEIGYVNGRTGDTHTIKMDDFHRIFRKLKADEL